MKNIMSGKKKITMVIIACLTAIINAYVSDPSQAETLIQLVTQFLPTIVAAVAAIFGLNREAKVDQEREKTKQLDFFRKQMSADSRVDVMQASKALRDMADEQVTKSFNASEFCNGIEERAQERYGVLNECTKLYSMWDKGKLVTCRNHNDLCLYGDLVLTQTKRCFEHVFGFPHSEAEDHLNDNKDCPYYSVDNMARQMGIHYWRALRELREAQENQRACEEMDVKGISWEGLYDDSLFAVWSFAGNFVSRSSG